MTNNDLISRTELLKEITLAEAASRTAYPKKNVTKRDIVDLIKNAPAKNAEPQNCCNWCQPNPDGEYTMLEFENPKSPAQRATVSFYDGMFAIELALDSKQKPARMSAQINYCPFCGRNTRYQKGNTSENDIGN